MARPYRDRSRDDEIRSAYAADVPVKHILEDYGIKPGTLYRIVEQRREVHPSVKLSTLTPIATTHKY